MKNRNNIIASAIIALFIATPASANSVAVWDLLTEAFSGGTKPIPTESSGGTKPIPTASSGGTKPIPTGRSGGTKPIPKNG